MKQQSQRLSLKISTAFIVLALATVVWITFAEGEEKTTSTDLAALRARLDDIDHRAQLQQDLREIENLQRAYGYYLDRYMWDEVADLFADDGVIEIGMRGAYVGKASIRRSLDLFGPHHLPWGRLGDHMNLQPVITVAPDGMTAKGRVRALIMNGVYQQSGFWGEGIYENQYVKEDGVWKIKYLQFFTNVASDYDKGWAKHALGVPKPSDKIPPDRPPSVTYENYPAYQVVPFHYPNPVTGNAVQIPEGARIKGVNNE